MNASSSGNGHERPPTGASDLKFDHPAPAGHARTISQVLGEITWLMSQSALHKQMFIADIEWLVMVPVMHEQFRLYYDQSKPIGVVLWAEVDAEVAARLSQGVNRLKPTDWKSGARVPEAERQLWAVEVIAPFGRADGGAPGAQASIAEDMVRELKAKVFPNRPVHYLRVGPEGRSVAVV